VRAEIQSSVRAPSGHLWSDTRVVAIYTVLDGLISSVELQDHKS
jgi:hypothetical protein